MLDVCNSNCYSPTSTWCNHAWPDNVLHVPNKAKENEQNKIQKEGNAPQQLFSLFPHWALRSHPFCLEAAAEQEEKRSSCPWRGLQCCPWHQALQRGNRTHSHIPGIPMAMESSPLAAPEPWHSSALHLKTQIFCIKHSEYISLSTSQFLQLSFPFTAERFIEN